MLIFILFFFCYYPINHNKNHYKSCVVYGFRSAVTVHSSAVHYKNPQRSDPWIDLGGRRKCQSLCNRKAGWVTFYGYGRWALLFVTRDRVKMQMCFSLAVVSQAKPESIPNCFKSYFFLQRRQKQI